VKQVVYMKTRESGVPEEGVWATFFTPEEVVRKLGLPALGDVVDFGCGCGTFTIPAAQITSGTVYAMDIDPEMVAVTEAKAAALPNVRVYLRDFVTATRRERQLCNVVQHPARGASRRAIAGGPSRVKTGRTAGDHSLELRSSHSARAVNGHPTTA
jgi:SAM-dependent methyltransferase